MLSRLKFSSENEVTIQKQKLNKVIAGQAKLKMLLAESKCIQSDSSSSETSLESNVEKTNQRTRMNVYDINAPSWCNVPLLNTNYPPAGSIYPIINKRGSDYYRFPFRRYGTSRDAAGPSRGFSRWSRGNNYRSRFKNRNTLHYPVYPAELAEEYCKYFYKFLQEDSNNAVSEMRSRSESKYQNVSKSTSRRSYNRSKSKSPSRSWSESKSRSRSRSLLRSKSRSRSKLRSRSRSKLRSRSRSKLRSRSRSRSKLRSRSRSRSKLRSKLKSKSYKKEHKSNSRYYYKEHSKHTDYHKSPRCSRTPPVKSGKEKGYEELKNRSCSRCSAKLSECKHRSESSDRTSVDSSRFISPSQMKQMCK